MRSRKRASIVRHGICAVAAVVALVPVPAAMQQAGWTAPLGIPEPPFGIREEAPRAPGGRDAVPGFYYVDASARGATDVSNPFGTPERPRATMPTPIPAGAVVELRGIYRREHTGRNALQAQGTKEKPVFIRSDPARRAEVRRPWEVGGTYFILEHLRFRDDDGVNTGMLTVLAPATRAAVRHSEISGNRHAGGFAIAAWGDATASEIVVYRNWIHDNGDVEASYDQDRHGIHISQRVNTVWIVDNEMSRNSGDGIQINAGSRRNQPGTHHIYVARNTSHHNKQNGFWTKQATDVIFSQNVAYANRPSNSSLGVGLGFQYAPAWVWFIANHVYDSDFGIQAASDSDLGSGTESFYIGNVIHDIHDSDGDFNPQTGWQNCGISLSGGINRYVIHNTLVNVDSGICSPGTTGKVEIHNNLVVGVRPDGQHLFLEHAALAAASGGTGNVFGPNYRAFLGGSPVRYDAEGLGANSVTRTPGFVLGPPWLLDLLPSSPAIDRGSNEVARIFALYRSRYGEAITRDFAGRPRLAGKAFDAGAFEYQPSATAR